MTEEKLATNLSIKIRSSEATEDRLVALETEISASDFYAQDHAVTKPVLDAFTGTQSELDLALERWTELEDQVRAYEASRQR